MRKNPLPALLALLLVATPVSLTACGTSDSADKPPVVEHNKVTDKPENQDETQSKEYATVDEQIQAWKDTGVLKPTYDPNVWKATKPLPRPAANLKYPKPEYPAKGYEHTQEGAEAVAIYLQELITYAFTTGDHTYLGETCSEASDMCNKMVAAIQKTKQIKNGWLTTTKRMSRF